MPSWLVPIPISSSAQIIPSLASPRIFDLAITKGSFPFMLISVPTVATITFCPAATFGAPQTICKGSACPMLTVVTLKRSALGCCSQVSTSPITNPFKPPGKLCHSSMCSTSKPLTDKRSAISFASTFVGRISRNQLIEIFIATKIGNFRHFVPSVDGCAC